MKTFCGLTGEYQDYKKSKFVIVPVPYDNTSSWMKGTDKGPDAIIEASEHMELYDIETKKELYNDSIHTDNPIKFDGNAEELTDVVFKRVKELLADDKFVVTLGGEHSVSIGSAKAHSEKYKDISVLQLDAHSDLRDSFEGDKYNHACVMARIKEFSDITQIGIRSMDSSEVDSASKIFYAHDIKKDKDWIKKVVDGLNENIYITIDLDIFDSSIMPCTGTPEPGGLDWYEVIDLLKEVAKQKNIVGFDVVELLPNKHNKAPDFLAAKLIYKLLCLIK